MKLKFVQQGITICTIACHNYVLGLTLYHPQITAMPRHIQACDNGATWHERGKGQDHVITGLKKNHQDISDTL